MAKSSSYFVCQQCSGNFTKWAGQCPNCGEWNSLVETLATGRVRKSKSRGKGIAGKRMGLAVKPVKLSQVESVTEKRMITGIDEFDRVLGGGIVPGSVVLVAGEPGIGKSTLLTQLVLSVGRGEIPQQSGSSHSARNVRDDKAGFKSVPALSNRAKKKEESLKVLYVCAEESPAQVKMRIERLRVSDLGFRKSDKNKQTSVKSAKDSSLLLLPEVDVDLVVESIEKEKPGLVIIDSIQAMFTSDLTSSAGSVSQVSECTARLIEVAKKKAIPVFLVGHVTKTGSIAGPKVLEHMVDTVLEISGDRQHEFRLLRANKNRFGTTDEVGIFAMEEAGMTEVANPSDRFLADRQKDVAGSCVVCVMEGTRPVLVEIQALVVPSQLAVPRRVASGVDQRRVQLLVAVLTKVCGLRLFDKDIYVNVAGGIVIREPASDFGIALAIASSTMNKSLPRTSVAVGEVGLLGEIRKVSRFKQRLSESKAQGFSKLLTSERFSSLREAVRTMTR